MKLELRSCREIIRVLEEEMCEISLLTQPVLNKATGEHNGNEPYNSSVKKWLDFFFIEPMKKTTTYEKKPPMAIPTDLKPVQTSI